MYRIGVDLGGTNIVAGVVDEYYRIVGKGKMPTACPRPSWEIINDVALSINMALEEAKISLDEVVSIGIGTPGSVNKKYGIIEYANNLGFDNVPAKDILQSKFSKPIYLENDANCAALGEAKAGAGEGVANLWQSLLAPVLAAELLLTVSYSMAVMMQQARPAIWLFLLTESNAPVAEKAVGRHIPQQRHLFARRKKLWAKISILLCGLLLMEI